MIRTTTLLLVLTLTGTPAATTLCIGWCDAEAAPGGTAVTCHHGSTRVGMPGVLAAERGCDARLQAEPFVREDVQRIASGSAADHAVVLTDQFSAVFAPDAALGGMSYGLAQAIRASHSTVLRI